MSVRVIENFLPDYYADLIEETVTAPNFPWFWVGTVVDPAAKNWVTDTGGKILPEDVQFGFTHSLYSDPEGVTSSFWNMFLPFFGRAAVEEEVRELDVVRARMRMTTNVGVSGRHKAHVDRPDDHIVLLYYVNDSDGETVFYNPGDQLQEVGAIAPAKNSAVLFDGRILHCSSAPTSVPNRVTFNVNFQ